MINKYTDNLDSFFNPSDLTEDLLAKSVYDLQHKGADYVPISDQKLESIFKDTKRIQCPKFKLKVPPWTRNKTSNSIKKCVLKAKKSTRGQDFINGRFLDSMPSRYQPIIENLFRTIFTTGTFFKNFRTNKVTCIDKSNKKEYRNNPKKKGPITVMDALRVCLERCCAAQFSEFCEKNGGFEDWQHGFRPCRSCSTAFAAFVRGSIQVNSNALLPSS